MRPLHAGNCQNDVGGAPLDIVVMIVPNEHAEASLVARRDDVYVGLVANATLQDRLDRQGMVAVRLDPIAAKLTQHAESIQHCLVDPIGRKVAEAVEPGLILEQERPGDGAFDLDACAARQLVSADHTFDDIHAIERAVTITVLRMNSRRAGGATLWIRFTNHGRKIRQAREFCEDGEIGLDIEKLLAQPHADVTLPDHRRALGVEGYEIDRRAGFADEREEGAKKSLRLWIFERSARMRAADARPWYGRLDRFRGYPPRGRHHQW